MNASCASAWSGRGQVDEADGESHYGSCFPDAPLFRAGSFRRMSTVLFALAPIVGLLAAFFGLRWSLREHRQERAPWLTLLDIAATDVGDGQPGTLAGIATEAGDALAAPFSGRPCLAYTCEIIVQEQLGNRTTWHRAYESGDGAVTLAGPDGAPKGDADLAGALPLFPPDLTSYNAFSGSVDTVFRGPPSALPPHLAAFVGQLSPEEQHLILRPSGQLIGGKTVYFNERLVVRGQPLVVVGPAARGESGPIIQPTEDADVFVGFGTKESERARIARLPIAGELFGAIMAGVIAGAMVAMVASMLVKK